MPNSKTLILTLFFMCLISQPSFGERVKSHTKFWEEQKSILLDSIGEVLGDFDEKIKTPKSDKNKLNKSKYVQNKSKLFKTWKELLSIDLEHMDGYLNKGLPKNYKEADCRKYRYNLSFLASFSSDMVYFNSKVDNPEDYPKHNKNLNAVTSMALGLMPYVEKCIIWE